MRKILEWWSIPPGLVNIMMTMITEHKLFVRHEGVLHDHPVSPTSGVLQGDTLAPFIFILCMDVILQQLKPEWGAVIENTTKEAPFDSSFVLLTESEGLLFAQR